MPEGDTIRRVAQKLAPLVGQTITHATTQGLPRAITGRTVTYVDAHGKHLTIDLDDATQLHIHQGMNGRFRTYARAAGDAAVAKISPGRASLVLATATHLYLWVTCPTVEIVPRRAARRGMAIAALGPDVLAGDFDSRQAAARAALHESRTIGEVLLDQRVVAGLGNIWKTEACFAARLDPRTRVRDVPQHALVHLYECAHELMRASVDEQRRPRDPRDFQAYARTNQPCPRCTTAIACYPLGDPPRWTWSCPHCQPPPAASR